jgi:23S rRNA (adenine2030-N6)-methyltransferase
LDAFDVLQAGIFGAMNYRHAFHAGNFADVVKHAILSRLVVHLRKKDSAFRVIDTHAGAGSYDLTGPEAVRSPEWRDGIGRLLDADVESAAVPLLADYLEAVRALNPPGKIIRYPGSPLLARAWLRRADRLVACELEPSAAKALAQNLHGDRRVKTVAIDGWTALSAYIPPKERRGLVLIDPPYEQPDEFSRLAASLSAAVDKWPTGIFFAWYPIKDASQIVALLRDLRARKMANMLRAEFTLSSSPDDTKLRGSGQLIVNPPWTLEQDLKILLPALAKILAPAVKDAVQLDWLSPKG